MTVGLWLLARLAVADRRARLGRIEWSVSLVLTEAQLAPEP